VSRRLCSSALSPSSSSSPSPPPAAAAAVVAAVVGVLAAIEQLDDWSIEPLDLVARLLLLHPRPLLQRAQSGRYAV